MPATPNVLRVLDPDLGVRIVTMPSPPSGATQFPGVPAGQPVLEAWAGIVSSDPGVNQDSTQGYSVGSGVFNNTAGFLRFWACRDATPGAAKWAFEGADYANGGTNPSSEITQAGSSTATIAAEGNIFRQVNAVPGLNPGGTGNDFVLAAFTIPANLFDGLAGTNRGLTITAQGSFGGTTNQKRCKIIFNPSTAVVGGSVGGGGVAIADTGTVTTNGSGWSIQANVFKYGAVASNTQLGIHQQSQVGGAVTPLVAPQNLTAIENAAILVAITGNATTQANDIALNFTEVNMMN